MKALFVSCVTALCLLVVCVRTSFTQPTWLCISAPSCTSECWDDPGTCGSGQMYTYEQDIQILVFSCVPFPNGPGCEDNRNLSWCNSWGCSDATCMDTTCALIKTVPQCLTSS